MCDSNLCFLGCWDGDDENFSSPRFVLFRVVRWELCCAVLSSPAGKGLDSTVDVFSFFSFLYLFFLSFFFLLRFRVTGWPFVWYRTGSTGTGTVPATWYDMMVVELGKKEGGGEGGSRD